LRRNLDLTAAAQADIAQILRSSAVDFGEVARSRYAALIAAAFNDLLSDPLCPTSVARSELQPGIRTYHLRHARQRAAIPHGAVKAPRHLIAYLTPTPDLVVVVRLLHDARELERHLGV